MDEDDLRAFEPILFREIGPRVTYNANFCRNPMCPNFGPAPDTEAYAARYTVKAVENRPRDRTYECNFCRMSWPLLSNRSLRAAYAWFKRQSVPFAACSRPGCVNEGVNVFEYRRRYRFDSKAKPHLARCRCEGRPAITLGESVNLKGTDSEVSSRLEEVFRSARDRGGLRDRIDNLLAYRDYAIGRSRYLRTLKRLAPRLRDLHSYCNTGLMAQDCLTRLERLFGEERDAEKPEALPGSPFNGVATLRTDAMSISLGKRKKSSRARGEDRDHGRHHLLQVQMASDPVAIQRGALKRLDEAFKGFWVKRGGPPGFPRFQGRRRWRSVSVISGVRLEADPGAGTGRGCAFPAWAGSRSGGGGAEARCRPYTVVG